MLFLNIRVLSVLCWNYFFDILIFETFLNCIKKLLFSKHWKTTKKSKHQCQQSEDYTFENNISNFDKIGWELRAQRWKWNTFTAPPDQLMLKMNVWLCPSLKAHKEFCKILDLKRICDSILSNLKGFVFVFESLFLSDDLYSYSNPFLH